MLSVSDALVVVPLILHHGLTGCCVGWDIGTVAAPIAAGAFGLQGVWVTGVIDVFNGLFGTLLLLSMVSTH